MTKQVPWLAMAALVAPFCVQVASAQTADEVVEQHLAAVGGREALGALTSRRATGTVTIGTPTGNLSGSIEISLAKPNRSRAYMELDLSALGLTDVMAIDQRFDGTEGWTLNSLQGDSAIAGDQLENMRNNTFPNSLMTYKEAGTTAALQPAEKIGDKDMIVLLVTPNTGSAVKLFLDATTYLVMRTVATSNVPELGIDVEQTSDFSDYRMVDGVQVAFSVVNSSSIQTVTIALTDVVHNVPFDDAIFKGR